MSLTYESESGTHVSDPSESELDSLLRELDGDTDSYSSLTAANGSYIQVGGGPTAFTVEVREVAANGEFRHLKAKLAKESRAKRRLVIGGESVSVTADQVLNFEDMRKLVFAFWQERKADSNFQWDDITSMFSRSS